MARVTLDRARRWHVSFTAPQPALERQPTGRAVGLDAGVVATLADSDGVLRHAPGLRPCEAQRLRRLRAISAQGWAMIRRRLQDKAATCAVTVVAVDPRGTSQGCAACGHTSPENRESQAVFRCRACGHRTNADVNAAVNILAAGLAVAARGGTPGSKGPDETRTQPVAA